MLMLLAVCIGVLAGACGESDGGGSSSSTRLSDDAYVEATSRIESSPAALDAEKRFAALAAGVDIRPKSDPPVYPMSASECRNGAKAFARDIHRIIDDVAVLRPPKHAEDLQRRFLAAADRSAASLDRLSADVGAGRVSCGREWNHRAFDLASTKEAETVLSEFARRFHLSNGEH